MTVDILDKLRELLLVRLNEREVIQEAIEEIQWLRAENWLKEGLN